MKSFSHILQESIDITQNPNFVEWFGDSKVVDVSGRPLVVHHGMNGELENGSFDPSRIGSKTDDGDVGAAFYFAANHDESASYAQRHDGQVLQVYLKIEHPFIVDDEYKQEQDRIHRARSAGERDISPNNFIMDLQSMLDSIGVDTSNVVLTYRTTMYDFVRKIKPAVFTKALQQLGYDGVFYMGEFAVYNSTQIKSAINNNGNFDPNDPDITH